MSEGHGSEQWLDFHLHHTYSSTCGNEKAQRTNIPLPCRHIEGELSAAQEWGTTADEVLGSIDGGTAEGADRGCKHKGLRNE